MRYNQKHWVGLLAVPFLLAGCLKTRNGSTSNQQVYAAGQATSQMQKANNDPNYRFSEVDENFRVLSGRLEVVEEKLSRADSNSDSQSKAHGQEIVATNQKLALLQEEMGKLESQISILQAELVNIRTSHVAADRSAKAKNPFELGQEYFSRKDWKQAILNYQKYRDENPKGAKFPEATYKIGVSFQELGLIDEARTFYDEVVAKFAKSEEAKKSKMRLKSLK